MAVNDGPNVPLVSASLTRGTSGILMGVLMTESEVVGSVAVDVRRDG